MKGVTQVPKLSIIIPIYNVEKYLKRCLNSVLKQTLQDIEIILVNDGSTDDSLIICEEYEKLDSRIILINKKNEGVSIARNIGIEISNADYIAFLDPDDEVKSNMYEQMYNQIIKNKSDICFCNYNQIDKKGCTEIKLPFSHGFYTREYIEKLIKEMIGPKTLNDCTVFGSVWRSLFRKDIIQKYNIIFPPNIRPMQDLVFMIEYLSKCSSMFIVNNAFYNYYLNPNSAVTSYKKNVWDNSYSVYRQLLRICKVNDLDDVTLERLNNHLVMFIINSISNEAHPDNINKYSHKIQNISNILELNKNVIDNLSYDRLSLKKKLVLVLMKKKSINLLYLYCYISQNYLRNF